MVDRFRKSQFKGLHILVFNIVCLCVHVLKSERTLQIVLESDLRQSSSVSKETFVDKGMEMHIIIIRMHRIYQFTRE